MAPNGRIACALCFLLVGVYCTGASNSTAVSDSSNTGFKCYCDNTSPSCRNGTCETDGFCFASISLKNGVETYEFGCVHRKSLIPLEQPFGCSAPKSMNTSIHCCATHMCNLMYVPSGRLPQPTTTTSSQGLSQTMQISDGQNQEATAMKDDVDKLRVETSGSASPQEVHFALSLVPLLRAQAPRARLDAEAAILAYFKKLQVDD